MNESKPKSAKLLSLPISGWAPSNKDVAIALRDLADDIEKSEHVYGSVICVMEIDGDVRRYTIGGPTDRARVIGLLFSAATRAVGECAGWNPDAEP